MLKVKKKAEKEQAREWKWMSGLHNRSRIQSGWALQGDDVDQSMNQVNQRQSPRETRMAQKFTDLRRLISLDWR